MEVIPAIDIRGGRCVRLYQGDFQKETIFSTSPVEVAKQWQTQGAKRLHVVDLDGAATGKPRNSALVAEIVGAVAIPVQIGGGIRSLRAVEAHLKRGAERVVLGTAAVANPRFVEETCKRFGEAIVVSVDAREGYIMVKGWAESTKIPAIELVEQMTALGVKRFVYTDISRDGTLTSPNFHAVEELVSKTGAKVLASGGISSIEHLLELANLGVEGAIIGKALYTGAIDLKEALKKLS
ncbi:MAG: 1-(5-phosphoribosyl)-5-[(5-phosphoribosylamino)methylideneamino]imidazole-4-carboxamide isomerase [Chloroflexi bacterium]|nr:1-(5-phosphoribosyl)-5-[(5-phosphoribosylamino)methylideneamino]imidazole-4-carboxamide isomerase [Chloroflexota bacterium]